MWRFVAIRPAGLTVPYEPHPLGYRDTAQLVETLKLAGATEVSVSAYPEKHPQSADWDAEIGTLKRKVDAGADRAITQFFFDNDLFDRYVDRVRSAGISIPIVPGIMPIHRFPAICNFASRCGATIPDTLARRFEGLDPDEETHAFVAAEVAAEQMADLVARGVEAFHIYTLNRAELSEAVCTVLGVAAPEDGTQPAPPEAAPLQINPKTIAPRKTKAAPTDNEVQWLDEAHRVASLCFTRRILTRKRRFQNIILGCGAKSRCCRSS